jgi:hypothetical protein
VKSCRQSTSARIESPKSGRRSTITASGLSTTSACTGPGPACGWPSSRTPTTAPATGSPALPPRRKRPSATRGLARVLARTNREGEGPTRRTRANGKHAPSGARDARRRLVAVGCPPNTLKPGPQPNQLGVRTRAGGPRRSSATVRCRAGGLLVAWRPSSARLRASRTITTPLRSTPTVGSAPSGRAAEGGSSAQLLDERRTPRRRPRSVCGRPADTLG